MRNAGGWVDGSAFVRMDSIPWGVRSRQMARPFCACMWIAGCPGEYLPFRDGQDNCQLPPNPKKLEQKQQKEKQKKQALGRGGPRTRSSSCPASVVVEGEIRVRAAT